MHMTFFILQLTTFGHNRCSLAPVKFTSCDARLHVGIGKAVVNVVDYHLVVGTDHRRWGWVPPSLSVYLSI